MSRLFFLFLLVAGSTTAQAQSTIVARMTNLRNNKGVCRVCLFDRAEAFKGTEGAPLQCREVPVLQGKAEAVFSNLPAGNYALFAFHDANANGKFDTNFLGIPKEGYGASRNNLPFAAAPGFESNKVQLPARSVLQLTMRFRNL
ncbi:DUF2141 domain-containing protein [Flaviaesturariibacter aridisoli]|uniref:DUF2141 domain-containing protein n=1 Tax=Flaviaesturariibacter aridisoli TaxID=2545761 RepID=A0A4V2WMM9_9BACT|nr:DUF2141 domain-containing protein [Flaviaesturariibacter aridisoli]TCZ71035.1 DUF2141 domain-containing protein [Flaviaesturariibacter aridisoli]